MKKSFTKFSLVLSQVFKNKTAIDFDTNKQQSSSPAC